ncbi:MAG: NAD(P)H-binding protein, partial [Chitinophagaceae bacterium]
GENMLQGSMQLVSGLFFGNLRKYKAIHGRTVASAMLMASKKEEHGFFRYQFDEIKKLALS